MRTSIFGGCLILFFTFLVTAADPRSRRYAIEGSFWGVRTVTYKFATPCSSLSLEQLQRVFKKAFEVWEERTGLVFQYSPNADAHIDIIFATGAHGDGEPFDGRGKILAHAFFPRYGGDLHFDDEELWSEDKNGPGLDLYAVAVHEIGHALGLKHSHEPAAIMAPFYHTYTGEKLHLHFDDLAGIDRLYGSTGVANRKIGIVHGTRQDKPDMCRNGRIDAITQILNGTIYAFQGEYFWKLVKFPSVDDYFPVKIADVWNITGPIDAAMTNSNGHTYIFKGKDYYIFNKECKLLGGYPKTIRKGLVDTPDKISAATAWHEDGQPYFFKDNKYWKYSRWGMGTEWPKRISELIKGKVRFFNSNKLEEQVPKRIEAALHLRDTGTFLFSGGKYWQISGKRKYRFYPRSTSEDWFNCKRSLEN